MTKLHSILSGWKTYFSGETPDFAEERAKICASCEHTKAGKFELLLNDEELKEVEGLKCGLCHCPLATKLRSKIERCPVDKW